jgi:hypothetical protein
LAEAQGLGRSRFEGVETAGQYVEVLDALRGSSSFTGPPNEHARTEGESA